MSFRIFLKENNTFRDFPVSDFSLQKKALYSNEIILNHLFSNTDHKKTYGKNIIIGGTNGFLGSILLSAKAAINTGSRYFIVCTNKLHTETVSLFQHELITLEYSIPILNKSNQSLTLFVNTSK